MTPTKFLTATSVLVALLGSAPAYAADAAATELTPSAEVEERIYRSCKRLVEDKLIRCKSRQLANWQQGQIMLQKRKAAAADPTKADNFIRNQLQERRRKEFEEKAKTRQTYRELDKSRDDANTERIPYLKALREARYKCMTETRPGRERNVCFDNLENEVRKEMERIERSKVIPGVPNTTPQSES